MRCLFRHKWVRKESNIRSVVAYRTCEQCGRVQRGFDIFVGEIYWETIRERDDMDWERIQFVRQSSSPLGKLAHSLGLRRSRMSDRRDHEYTPQRSGFSWLRRYRERYPPFWKAPAEATVTDESEEQVGTRQQQTRDPRIDTPLSVFLENATGVTRDMSVSGVFFWTSGTYATGESIRFAIELKTAKGRMMRKCKGIVVRTEPHEYMIGVATRITESTMEPAQT